MATTEEAMRTAGARRERDETEKRHIASRVVAAEARVKELEEAGKGALDALMAALSILDLSEYMDCRPSKAVEAFEQVMKDCGKAGVALRAALGAQPSDQA